MTQQRKSEIAFDHYLDAVFRKHRDRTFVVDATNGRQWTFGTMAAEVMRVRQQLAPLVGRGQPVAVLMRNSAEFFVVCLALMHAGHTFFLLSPDWPAAAVARHLDALRPSLLVSSPDLAKDLMVGRPTQVAQTLAAYVMPNTAVAASRVFSSPRIFLATSGTTAINKWVPKGSTEIARNLTAWAARLGLNAEDRVHSMLPLCTANGLYITFLMPFLVGAAIILDQRFSGATLPSIYRNACAQRSTIISIVPTILYMTNEMLSDEDSADFRIRSVARFAICGTAPLDHVEKLRFAGRMNLPVCFNFGTTETMFVSSQSTTDWEDDSTGRPLDGVELSIADDGEVIVGKEGCFEPYLGLERGGFRDDGKYATGDLGRLQAGRLSITGRKKDMVIVGGFNVFPAEVDHLIIREPHVIDTYTFGVPNVLLGEELVSTIVLDNSLSPDHVISAIEERLALQLPSYKVPRVLCVKEIIKTPTGKPIKRAMIEEVGRMTTTWRHAES